MRMLLLTSAKIVGLIGIGTIIGRIVGGFLLDRMDGRLVATSNETGEVVVWSAAPGEPLLRLAPGALVMQVQFTADGVYGTSEANFAVGLDLSGDRFVGARVTEEEEQDYTLGCLAVSRQRHQVKVDGKKSSSP